MAKKNGTLAAQDGKPFQTKGRSQPNAPVGGGTFATYSLKEELRNEEFAENWQAFFGRSDRNKQLVANPRRAQRPNGKILEADRFRKMQGVFLKTRLHAIAVAEQAGSGLKWWFANSDRITLHHLIMCNYYLSDAPTEEDEIKDTLRCTSRTVRTILRTAVEIGSLDSSSLGEDGRRKCYYPTRGMVSDTDHFFGSSEEGAEGIFTRLHRLLTETFGKKRMNLDEYVEEYEEFNWLISVMMESAKKSS